MLSILINWLYMGIVVFIMGTMFLYFFDWVTEKTGGYFKDSINQNVTYYLYSGIVVTTVYAQIFSLFHCVGLLANIVILLLTMTFLIWKKKLFLSMLRNNHKLFCNKKTDVVLNTVIIILAIIIFAASSAGPAKLIDTDWYHAQTIRWIEEYGCVKGVANLFYALGFNNAQHYFDALFSMQCYIGQSLRGTGGFFGLIIFLHGFMRVRKWKEHRKHIADIIGIWEIAYSIIITAFYADPYVDTLPNGLVLFITCEWYSLLENNICPFNGEEKEKQWAINNMKWMAFYCILAVFAVVAKTSVATVVLITLCPAIILLSNKKWKEIGLYLALGCFIIIPFFITNIMTTGYPVYLFSAFDIVSVPWKVDASVLNYSIDNMIAFARMPSVPMEQALNMGLSWVPDWFMRESISHKLLYIAVILMILYDLIKIISHSLHGKRESMWYLWPRFCIYAGLVYWFFTIPQVKYCWSFLILPLAIVPSYYWREDDNQKKPLLSLVALTSGILFLLYTGFYMLRTAGYAYHGLKNHFWVQQDYENHVFNQVEKNGHRFYTRIKDGDIVCGYYIFPYLDNEEELEFLHVGSELDEGFYFEK